jgi:hypothetical protein
MSGGVRLESLACKAMGMRRGLTHKVAEMTKDKRAE